MPAKHENHERELVNALRNVGYGSLRLPASGSGTSTALPDILVATRTEVEDFSGPLSDLWAVEHKACNSMPAYLQQVEVERLTQFCELWGARPLIGVKEKGPGARTKHHLIPEDTLRRTSEMVVVERQDIPEKSERIIMPETDTKDARMVVPDDGG